MSEVATLIADMVRAGVDPDIIGRTAAALASRDPANFIDEQAERRRASDRERKRNARLRNSAESADTPQSNAPALQRARAPILLPEVPVVACWRSQPPSGMRQQAHEERHGTSRTQEA